jgi:peptide/nickel transport system permease protein
VTPSSTAAARFWLGRLAAAVPVLLGVTLISFTLTVWLGPDPTWSQLGRNPSPQDIEQLERTLGLDRPFIVRYGQYLYDLARLDLGYSHGGEPVGTLLGRTLAVTVLLIAPGMLVGLALALALALHAAWRPGGRVDRLCDGVSAVGTSLSVVIVIIALQTLFGGVLDWLPARGWRTGNLTDYLRHVTVPSLALIIGGLGYNLRFFRAVLREALSEPAVRTARAYGFGTAQINRRFVLRAAAPALLTRILVSLPVIAISGSLVIERHFGIPGLGRATWDAVMSGDQAVLMAVVSLSSIAFVVTLALTDAGLRALDPRTRQA